MKNKKQKPISKTIIAMGMFGLIFPILLYMFFGFLETKELFGLIVSGILLLLTTIIIVVLMEVNKK